MHDEMLGRFVSYEALLDYADALEREAEDALNLEDKALWLEEALAAKIRAVQLESE